MATFDVLVGSRDTAGAVEGAVRLVTVVELDEHNRAAHSAWAHLYIELSSGVRIVLLDDRGWSSSAEIAHGGLRAIEDTARMVVGPDKPGPGETYWNWMEHKLCDAGVRVEAAELKVLPHVVEVGERLRRQLARSS